jgi:hypothetical protein
VEPKSDGHLSQFWKNKDWKFTISLFWFRFVCLFRKLVNLGKMKKYFQRTFFNKWKRLVFLKRYLDENNFDFIIDFDFDKTHAGIIIAKWLYKTKSIFMVHSYLIDHYMPNWSFLSRYMYGDCYKVVCITNESINKKKTPSKERCSNL